jgi:hypothetical protein
VLVLEAIKSLHLHANGIEHPLQALAEAIIDENGEEIQIVIDIQEDLE